MPKYIAKDRKDQRMVDLLVPMIEKQTLILKHRDGLIVKLRRKRQDTAEYLHQAERLLNALTGTPPQETSSPLEGTLASAIVQLIQSGDARTWHVSEIAEALYKRYHSIGHVRQETIEDPYKFRKSVGATLCVLVRDDIVTRVSRNTYRFYGP